MRILAVMLTFAMFAGCAAKDPNKITPSKTIGETVCANSQGERVSCPEKKTQ